jgi:hypothetical protein
MTSEGIAERGFSFAVVVLVMLGGSLVTTAWLVFWLQMEDSCNAQRTLNKQFLTNDRGWSSSLGFGHGCTIPYNKKYYKMLQRT